MNDRDQVKRKRANLHKLIDTLHQLPLRNPQLEPPLVHLLQQAAAFLDEQKRKAIKRKRGDRSKLDGGIMLEDLAVVLTELRKAELMREKKLLAKQAWDQAKFEVGPYFGVKADPQKKLGTIDNWKKNFRIRYNRRRKR